MRVAKFTVQKCTHINRLNTCTVYGTTFYFTATFMKYCVHDVLMVAIAEHNNHVVCQYN